MSKKYSSFKKKTQSLCNGKIVVVIVCFVIIWSLYRRAKGKRGTSVRYNVRTFRDYQRIFPQAFRPIDTDISTGVDNDSMSNVSKGEQRCRAFLEQTFQLPFPKTRPHFLNNPVTSSDLELDCFNESLRLAVEYQGEQHYKYIPYFHSSKEAFYNQQYRDVLKRDLCKKKNIILIEVPHYCKNIEEFLKSALIENGFLH